jgi:hypothetical protein
MKLIIAPISPGDSGPLVANLQDALLALLEREIIRPLIAPERPTLEELQKLSAAVKGEREQLLFGQFTQELIRYFQVQQGLSDNLRGVVEDTTAAKLNEWLKKLGLLDITEPDGFVVRGSVKSADGKPLVGAVIQAFDRDMRKEQALGKAETDDQGQCIIRFSSERFATGDVPSAIAPLLIVRAFLSDQQIGPDVIRRTPTPDEFVEFKLPALDLSKWEQVTVGVIPLLQGQGEGDQALPSWEINDRDLNFIAEETEFEKQMLARFVLAHKLAQHGIQPEFWFALLGGSFFEFDENKSLEEQAAAILDSLSSLDAAAVRKSLTRAFYEKDIPEAFQEKVADWIEAFLRFAARWSISGAVKPAFARLALEHAGIEDTDKQEKFSRLFNQHKTLTPELLAALEKDASFKKEEIADLRTSFQLSDLTRGDFSVVKMLKEEFDIRQPEEIRALAKKSESEWVNLVKEKHAAGDIKLPIDAGEIAGQMPFPAAEVYGKTLERQFREAFPTTAFAGGLERALSNGGTHGLRNADDLSRFLQRHENFELLNTPVDDFLKNNIPSDFQPIAKDEDFRLELKAVQRVFKLAPTFEATDAMLADGVHSAQMAYRMGESEFVRRYADSPGFTGETARLAWNRAADTYAAVLTVVADLKALEAEASPLALQNNSAALSNFPNWNDLFKSGDLCECEHCRSALSPATYFADILMFLKDRKAKNPAEG